MNIIVKIKRLFRFKGKKYEIWDTSAIRNRFKRFSMEVETTDNVVVVIPEGVSNEISSARHSDDHCMIVYNFLLANASKIKEHITDDKMRAWSVDEQVVAITEWYHKKGYNAVLVTCDHNEAHRAKLKGLSFEVLSSSKNMDKTNTTLYTNSEENKDVLKVEELTNHVKQVIKTSASKPIREPSSSFVIPCKQKGNMTYIASNFGAVFNSKGKRVIGRGDYVAVTKQDTIEVNNYRFCIKEIKDSKMLLARV